MVKLDKPAPAFRQPAGEQAVGRKTSVAGLFNAVGVERGFGFLPEIGQLGNRCLHLERHLILADARGDFRVIAFFGEHSVEPLNLLDHQPLDGLYNPDGSLQSNELGPSTNANFGKIVPSTNTQDPATLNGFGARGSTVEWTAAVQHELMPRVALSAGYYFRWNGNQLTIDNTLVSATFG